MTFLVREATGLTEIGEMAVRESGGLSSVEMWVRDASGLQRIFGSFSLSSDLPNVSGSTSSHTAQRISTSAVTVTPNPPGLVDSVAWSFADTGWEAISPSSLTTAFRSPPVSPIDGVAETTATCTATRGATSANHNVGATATNFGS